jgi:two-component system phosphate regulon sensor histidine kinase PhoR
VNSIVAAHGGEVTVESELGRGTTFRVTLPHVTD